MAEVVRRVVKPVLAHSCESCTTNKRQRSKMKRIIENKTKLDGIRNEVYRDELKVELIEVRI